MAGISDAVIFQRFGTKEALFFAAMILPKVQLETMLNVPLGQKQVKTNLQSICLRIVVYLREVMPIFLSLISHPSFDRQTFLQRHTMPRVQIEHELTAYLTAEADLGRIHLDNIAVETSVLFSYLHNLMLSETIEAHHPTDIDRAIFDAIALLS